MIDVVCHHDPRLLPLRTDTCIPVLLYGATPAGESGTSIGGPVRVALRRLGIPTPQKAFDFLTVALAVTAADTFVSRELTPDGWTRYIRLHVPVYEASIWKPVVPLFEKALRFLSGDIWTISIQSGGPVRPEPQARGRLLKLLDHDSVCLFSGGLDSTIGALDLLADGTRPVLVSHGYRGDQSRQYEIHQKLPVNVSWFTANANPVSRVPNDTTMRTRSLNFLAYGAVIASTLAELTDQTPVQLIVPENGFIALNAPLTRRRLGSLSTRTTHPHFLNLIQRIFAELGIPVILNNPYGFSTKGEMLANSADPKTLSEVAARTVSCGKWKRRGKQCGRCVPCLIRRASFFAAGRVDSTEYHFQDLSAALANLNERDDLLAVLLAVRRLSSVRLERWVAQSGPLPTDRTERSRYVQVFQRGLAEMDTYLTSLRLPL